MALQGEPDDTASPNAEDLLDVWRARLLRSCCLLSGAALLLAILVFWRMTGVPIPGFSWLCPLALSIMTLPWLGRRYLWLKSFAYTVLLASALATLGYNLGWAPGNVALSCFLVSASGLLLKPRFGYGFLVLQALALVIAGQAVGRGAFRVDETFVNATRISHWVRAALVLGVLGVALWALLRSLAALIQRALQQAAASVALAERQLHMSRALREARISDERKLRAPQKLQALGKLAGGFAHLINNELTVVAGALHDLETDWSVSARRDVAQRIAEAVSRVATPVRQLLELSRHDEPDAQPLDLAVQLRAIVAELRPAIASDVVITVQGNDGHVLVIEPSRLRLLLLNLLLNSVDALPSGGRILITVRAEQNSFALIIEDDGHGMSADVLTRAADTFFTTRDRAHHAGLGLSVAASIAEQSAGVLAIESAPQIGTRVCVCWPGVSAPDAQLDLMHPAQLTPTQHPPPSAAQDVALPTPQVDIDH